MDGEGAALSFGDTADMQHFAYVAILLVGLFGHGMVHAQPSDPVTDMRRRGEQPFERFVGPAVGQYQVVYLEAPAGALSGVATVLREAAFGERFAQVLSMAGKLPKSSALVMRTCGEPNAMYISKDDRGFLVFCYELGLHLMQMVDGAARGRQMPATIERMGKAFAGAALFILLHELGHALVHQWQIPVLGKGEDAADTLASYIFLERIGGDPGILEGALLFFSRTGVSAEALSGVHSLDPQRQALIACFALGADPQRYWELVRLAKLPESRARGCRREYEQMVVSAQRLAPGAWR